MLYSYRIKIINPKKKSEFVVCNLPDLCNKFESILVLRAKLVESLGEQVPKTLTFNVGYYQGQQHSEISLYTDKDLDAMYQKCPSGEITLWCEGNSGEDSKCKRDDPSVGQKKEDEVDSIFQELKEKNGTKYDIPRLSLWARMVASNLHDDLDTPPTGP